MYDKQRNTGIIRNNLHQTGQKLERELRVCINKFQQSQTDDIQLALSIALGAMQGYIASRKAVAPYISIDIALASQDGLCIKARLLLNKTQVTANA